MRLAVCVLAFLAGTSPRAQLSLSVVGYSSSPDAVGVGTGSIRVDGAWLVLRDARARPAASCKRSAARPVISKARTVDLLHPSRSSTVEIEAEHYCALDLSLSTGARSAQPVELRGASIAITGQRADGVAFSIRSRLDVDLLLRASSIDGFPIRSPSTAWILGVDLYAWLHTVNLDDAEVGTDKRRIAIDETSNPERLAEFETNIGRGLFLFLDSNQDEALDTSERRSPIATK